MRALSASGSKVITDPVELGPDLPHLSFERAPVGHGLILASADADVAKPGRCEPAGIYEPTFRVLVHGLPRFTMEIGLPRKRSLLEARLESREHRGRRVEVLVLVTPLLQVDADLPGRASIEALPGELVENENAVGSKERHDPVESSVELADVVQRATCDHRLERARLLELLDRRASENLAIRCIRVDREYFVTRRGKLGRQLTVAAADLEHTGGRRRELRQKEREYVHVPKSLLLGREDGDG
jgi:hypothetical protein